MSHLESVVGPNATNSLSQEHTLLLALSRRDLTAQERGAIRAFLMSVDSAFDWGKFVDSAARHGVLHLASHHLHSSNLSLGSDGQSAVPYRWLYSQVFRGNFERNLLLQAEFSRILRAVNDTEVPFLVRKGPTVINDIHGSLLGVRRVGDLDLLVDRAQRARFGEILEVSGYRCGHRTEDRLKLVSFDRPTSAYWRIHLSNVNLPYMRVSDSDLVEVFVIDLCFDIFQPRAQASSQFQELYSRSRKQRLWGELANCLCIEDQIIDLAIQMHMEATILYFIELGKDITLLKLSEFREYILAIANTHGTEALLTRAHDMKCIESVAFACLSVEEVFPGSLPFALLEKLQTQTDSASLRRYGEMDGSTLTWKDSLLSRLFNARRKDELSEGKSTVPGPRAVI
jgi:Uncharacterised nucleotidyltransferase